MVQFENVLKEIGDCGRAQIFQYFLLCLCVFNAGFISVDVVFFSARPKHHCRVDTNVTTALRNIFPNASDSDLLPAFVPFKDGAPSSCFAFQHPQSVVSHAAGKSNLSDLMSELAFINRTQVACDSWTYATDVYGQTFVTELDLVCNRKLTAMTIKTLFFVGRLFGSSVLGPVSDRFGRLPTLMLTVVINVATGVGLFFSTNIILIIICIFMHGMVQVGFMLTCFVLGTELVGTKYRKWFGIVLQIWYAAAMAIVPGISLLLPNWHHLALASCVPSLFFFSYAILVKESPRWLITRGRNAEALTIIKAFAKRNGRTLSKDTEDELMNEQPEKADRVYTAFDLVRTWSRAKITLNVWFNWVVNSLVYYGIIYNLDNIGANPYINMLILGLVEFPAYGLSIAFVDVIGRKKLLIGSLFLAGAFCTACGFVPKEPSWIVTIFAMTGKFGITISYGIIYVMTAELFPTCVRNMAVGMGSTFARVGCTFSNPILRLEDTGHRFLPMLVFGLLSLAAASLGLLLPETKGRRLKNTFEETDNGSHSSVDKDGETAMKLVNGRANEEKA